MHDEELNAGMKFAIFPQDCLPIYNHVLEDRPLGGMETAVVRFAQALEELGNDVIVFTPYRNPPLSRPLYLPITAIDDLSPVDVFIVVRQWEPLLLPVQRKLTFFWTGDAYDQPQSVGIGDRRVAAMIDTFLIKSDWQADTICRTSNFPREKCRLLKNGVYPSYFDGTEPRTRKRMMYSSTPYRGLKFLPEIFTRIREKHSEAELHVFSDYDVYLIPGESYYRPAVAEYKELAAKMREIPGCFLHGNILQQALAREFMKSAVLAYPNTFAETSCTTVLEAQAAGCVVITSRLGALPESVGDAGILLEAAPGTPEYIDQFVSALDRVFSDDEYFEKLSQRGRERAKQYEWPVIAREFDEFCRKALEAREK